MKYISGTIVLLNLACMIGAYVVAGYVKVSVGQFIDQIFKGFDCYYVLEALAKLIAFVFFSESRLKHLKNKVFLLELVIGCCHLLDLVFWTPITATRVIRLLFVLRILTLFESLRKFTLYIIQSLPALFLIVSCFFTIFFGYSIISIELFGSVDSYRCRYVLLTQVDTYSHECDALADSSRIQLRILRQRGIVSV